jgi:hypothetical protein
MLGAKYDFSRDRERRAGVDDMVNKEKSSVKNIFLFILKFRYSCQKILTQK